MNRNELITDLRRCVSGGGFITRAELAAYMNLKDPKSIDRYLSGLPRINKRYFIADIADRLLANCNWRE